MQVSAELRWFWKNAPPPGLEDWFKRARPSHPSAPGGGVVPRTDLYRRDAKQVELGIKLRGGKPGYEVKGLVEDLGRIDADPFVGNGELWTKWTVEGLRFDAEEVVATTKLRWIRKLDTSGQGITEVELGADEKALSGARPQTGCQVELTQIFVGDEGWWSFSFESFGTVATVERDLRAGAAEMAKRSPPALADGAVLGYPAWLSARLG
jgi:hypothetical protein